MAEAKFTLELPRLQYRRPPPHEGLEDLADELNAVDWTPVVVQMSIIRYMGRPGYSPEIMLRAYQASYQLNLGSTNDLIRRLRTDPWVKQLVGFDGPLPHRTTFNRFIRQLGTILPVVDLVNATLIDWLKGSGLLPGLGDGVAVDSTNVRTHSNPDQTPVSDPDAKWGGKTKYGTDRDGDVDGDGEGVVVQKEWHFGYKLHSACCARWGIHLGGWVTPANQHDGAMLVPLLDKLKALHDWWAPKYVMADKAYDSMEIHKDVNDRGAAAIIAIRKLPRNATSSTFHTQDGTPTCMGNVPMEYVGSDPERGDLYRCPKGGCHLKGRKGVLYCQDNLWEPPSRRQENPRLFPAIRRDSPEWVELYGLRQAVERIFKSLKESRRLNAHYVRGMLHLGLHSTMSALASVATAVMHVNRNDLDMLCWQKERVA